MSSIMSPVRKIDDLRIEKFPSGRVFSPEKVVRYDGVTVMTKKGDFKIYCDAIDNHVCYAPGNKWPFTDGLMKCLLKIGVITKAQMDEHIAWEERRCIAEDKKYTLEYMQRKAEKYGFVLSAAQKQALT